MLLLPVQFDEKARLDFGPGGNRSGLFSGDQDRLYYLPGLEAWSLCHTALPKSAYQFPTDSIKDDRPSSKAFLDGKSIEWYV